MWLLNDDYFLIQNMIEDDQSLKKKKKSLLQKYPYISFKL